MKPKYEPLGVAPTPKHEAPKNPPIPKKLLMTKWTAAKPRNREKHFVVMRVIEPEPPSEGLLVQVPQGLKDKACICRQCIESSHATNQVKVKPNGRSSAPEQLEVGSCTATLKPPPVDGKAHAELSSLFAKHFKVPKASVVIKSGASSRSKLVSVGLAPASKLWRRANAA